MKVGNDQGDSRETLSKMYEDSLKTRTPAESSEDIDLVAYYEEAAGRLVVDPQQAKIEFGESVASRLKLSEDGSMVLWPQPYDDPNDPQNWSNGRKALHLLIIAMAAFVPDFDSAIGIAALFELAKEYKTTTGVINDLTSNWSIFLIGWGGVFYVMLMRRFGRLPVLFWTQLLSLGFLVGATFAPNLPTFAAMRCLTGFFGTCPQVTGLFVVTDIYPFHLQARKLNVWTLGFIISPFISPFAFGFLVARANWRWSYGIGCIYSAIVLTLIILFMEETMYDRGKNRPVLRRSSGFRYRFETLIGVTGCKLAKYRASWWAASTACLQVVWRPQFILVVVFEAAIFGFSIGMNVTNVVFLGTPAPVGFGYREDIVAAAYATPMVAVVIGELIGRFLNDWIMKANIRRNGGFFEAESRLWVCYLATPLFLCGSLVLGAGIQHLNIVGVVFGWGIAEIAVMINTVAIYAYCNDCFPKRQGEISALINLARVLGGFSVAYFQVPWSVKSGGLMVMGVEAAITVGLFLIAVPLVQWQGSYFRRHFSVIISWQSLSLFLFSASATVKASPCVAFDINWNLLAFGLDGKDWSAGTQDTWLGSGKATDITTTGRPSFDGTNTTCYLSQYTNAIYVLNGDSKSSSSLYIYDATAKSWTTQAVTLGSFDTTSFDAILDHDTNVLYALSHGNLFSLDMGLLKAANSTAVAWVSDEQSPYPSNYQPVMALAQNHIHFLNVPGVAAGSADIFVIHYSYFQPQSQVYPLPDGSAFPATYGHATSFFQESGVQQEFAFVPQDSSAVYVINVETNSTQKLAGPTIKDSKATYFASTNSLVQLSGNGTVSFLPYQEGNTSTNAAASWLVVKPLATAAPPSTSVSASGTQTALGSSSTSTSSGSTGGTCTGSSVHVGFILATLLSAMTYLL